MKAKKLLIFISLIKFVVASTVLAQDQKLPPVQICETNYSAQFFVDEQDGYYEYQCDSICTDWKSCSVCSAGECQLNFTVDKMAGSLYYRPVPQPTKSVVYFSGGGGTKRESLIQEVQLASEHLLVEVTWAKGVTFSNEIGEWDTGWFTRTNTDSTSIQGLSRRPAAVLKWVHDELSNGSPLATAGCSGGTVQTFSSVFWHGLDPIVDYQVMGGAPYFDWIMACGSGPKKMQLSNVFLKKAPVDRLLDYIHKTGNICQSDGAHPSFMLSSPRYTPGDWEFDHRVDLGLTRNFLASDRMMGIFYQALAAFSRIKGDKHVETFRGPHCVGSATHLCESLCTNFLDIECECPTLGS